MFHLEIRVRDRVLTHTLGAPPTSRDVALMLLDMLENDMEQAMQESLATAEPVRHPTVTKAELDKIAPIQTFKRGFGHDDSPCSVCQCGFKARQHVRRLPCGHLYHARCLEKWVCKTHSCCPVCRQELKQEPPPA